MVTKLLWLKHHLLKPTHLHLPTSEIMSFFSQFTRTFSKTADGLNPGVTCDLAVQ